MLQWCHSTTEKVSKTKNLKKRWNGIAQYEHMFTTSEKQPPPKHCIIQEKLADVFLDQYLSVYFFLRSHKPTGDVW